jgi:hypothetical protein
MVPGHENGIFPFFSPFLLATRYIGCKLAHKTGHFKEDEGAIFDDDVQNTSKLLP